MTFYSIRDFTPYGHALKAIDEWAAQFEEFARTSSSHKVKEWNSLKNSALGRKPHATKDELKRDAIGHLRKLQRMPQLVRSFFHKPSTIYAAA